MGEIQFALQSPGTPLRITPTRRRLFAARPAAMRVLPGEDGQIPRGGAAGVLRQEAVGGFTPMSTQVQGRTVYREKALGGGMAGTDWHCHDASEIYGGAPRGEEVAAVSWEGGVEGDGGGGGGGRVDGGRVLLGRSASGYAGADTRRAQAVGLRHQLERDRERERRQEARMQAHTSGSSHGNAAQTHASKQFWAARAQQFEKAGKGKEFLALHPPTGGGRLDAAAGANHGKKFGAVHSARSGMDSNLIAARNASGRYRSCGGMEGGREGGREREREREKERDRTCMHKHTQTHTCVCIYIVCIYVYMYT